MWTYRQSTGELFDKEMNHVSTGYAGNGVGKNNPEKQEVHGIGPLPRGLYTIGPAHDSPTHGPVTMDLTPNPANLMFGRDLFRVHGERKPPAEPGNTSLGCMVMGLVTRTRLSKSDDKLLEVVE